MRRCNGRAVVERLVGAEERTYVSPIHVALVSLGLGRHDEFFLWLERAITERSTWLVRFPITPSFDLVHDDPRFQDALQRIGGARVSPRRAPMAPEIRAGSRMTSTA